MAKITFDEDSLKSFTKTMRLEAAARLAGKPITGQQRNAADKWLVHLKNILESPRSVSPPVIAISAKTGLPLTFNDVKTIKEIAQKNASTTAEEVFYVSGNAALKKISLKTGLTEAQIVEKYQERWDTYSSQSGTIFGKAKSSSLEKEIKTIKDEYIIVTKRKPPQDNSNRLQWIRKKARAFVRLYKIGLLINSAAVKFGIVISEGTGYEELYVFKVRGPKVLSAGGAAIPISRSQDFNNFTYVVDDKVEGPYNNIIPQGYSRQASAIAHWRRAEKTKNLENLIDFYKQGLTYIIAQQSSASGSDLSELNEAEKGVSGEIAQLETLLNDVGNASSILADFTVNPKSLSVRDPTFLNAKSRVKVTDKYVTVPVINNQATKITSRDITITNDFAVELFNDQDVEKYFDSSAAFNSGAQSAYEKMSAKVALDLINTAGSYSPIKFLVLQSLATIFQSSKLAKSITSKKPGNSKGVANLPIGRKGKKVKILKEKPQRLKNKIKDAIPELYKRTKQGRVILDDENLIDVTSSQFELLTIINANLKDAVLSNMGSGSLVNRSGVFAGSVEALSIINNIVTTKYKKDPYQVFQQVGGAAPWNSEKKRDPINIINNAIEKISREKLNNIALINEVI